MMDWKVHNRNIFYETNTACAGKNEETLWKYQDIWILRQFIQDLQNTK
jgi:hypothetical protein